MKKQFIQFPFLYLVILIFLLNSCQNDVQSPCIQQQEVGVAEAQLALDNALAIQGAEYKWGGNGPEVFDCSGLIVWAYWQALSRQDLFYDGYGAVSDASMQMLYDYNVRRIGVE
ncbi:MAG: C40 family peptidase, partial [Spirochaetia bacterium]|nr:C40 family peptidase [Spirochaetia bacterium]